MKGAVLPDVNAVVGHTDSERRWLDDAALRERAGRTLQTGLTRELWKYTPIRGFLEALAAATAGDRQPSFHGADQPGLTVTAFDALDGAAQATLQQLIDERFDADRHPLADLSLLRAAGGWLVDVAGAVTEPLTIRYPAQGVVPVFVRLAPRAQLTLIEQHDSSGFLAQVTYAELAAGARLDQHRAPHERDVAHYSLLHVQLAKDAAYRLNQSCLGGRRRRAEVHVVLDGPCATADLAGAYLVEDGQHLDQQLLVEHRAGHTRSRQKFHGIGAGKGRSVFNGRIHIHPHAPQSDAALSKKTLALHPQAEMNTKPELEIYTDDVRCAHGATVGRLSEDALFYLTARGIVEAEARRLLAYGFVRECLDGPLAERSAERLREALTA